MTQAQIAGSGKTIASESGEMATAAPVSTTNSMGRRGVNRSDTRPPAISPNASAAVIAPQAAGPAQMFPGDHRAEDRERPVPGHHHDAELRDDHPQPGVRPELRPALTQLAEHVRAGRCRRLRRSARLSRPARMDSSSGTVLTMPIPHSDRAQPGPAAATSRPATAAPDICPVFMASRLIALASCSRPRGTRRGSSAWDAG